MSDESNNPTINTGGGTYVDRDVNTGGGDLVGRDKHTHYHGEAVEPPPPPFTMPLLPEHFVQRPTEFGRLRDLLLQNGEATRTISITTALQGGGGFGKTTLALALCHDDTVRDAFPDGILWLTIGQTPQLMGLLTDQIAHLTGKRPGFADINAATAHLRNLLEQKRVLLVLDDVWNDLHARPFVQPHPTCVHLVTTRKQDVVTRLVATAVDVNEMQPNEASALLVKWLPQAELSPGEQTALREFAASLGEWPLLLELAAAQLTSQVERLRRFLNNPALQVRAWYEPLVVEPLAAIRVAVRQGETQRHIVPLLTRTDIQRG